LIAGATDTTTAGIKPISLVILDNYKRSETIRKVNKIHDIWSVLLFMGLKADIIVL